MMQSKPCTAGAERDAVLLVIKIMVGRTIGMVPTNLVFKDNDDYPIFKRPRR